MLKTPNILWGLIILPFLFYFLIIKRREGSIKTSFFSLFLLKKTFRIWLFYISWVLLILALASFLIALARPQKGYVEERLITEGIDIILALDISSSMKAEDFKPSRLGAAKVVAKEFIKGRRSDRIGLVIFSRKAITTSPLTIDYGILYNFIDSIETGMIQDGTAIGNAIAEGGNRLKEAKEKNKVLILLTDGINNSGEIDPLTASYGAKALHIKVYTIGVGSRGNAPYPIDDPVFGKRYVSIPVQIDEDILKDIAGITGGKYYRATDTKKLEEIYREIDQLEKSKIEITQYKKVRERFAFPLVIGIFLFILHVSLLKLYLKVIP